MNVDTHTPPEGYVAHSPTQTIQVRNLKKEGPRIRTPVVLSPQGRFLVPIPLGRLLNPSSFVSTTGRPFPIKPRGFTSSPEVPSGGGPTLDSL